MQFSEWEPVYEKILNDFGYCRSSDERNARLLKTLLMNSDLISDDELRKLIKKNVTVLGGGNLDVSIVPSGTTTIATGSSIELLLSMDIIPDVIVTDLDGNVEAQKNASEKGSVTVIHAHGDNADAIMHHAKEFSGKIVMTTQSRPDLAIYNFGGFTDGDRAVCMARHFGAERIYLAGFDFERPAAKENSDPKTKKKKLDYAKSIIDVNAKDIIFLKK